MGKRDKLDKARESAVVTGPVNVEHKAHIGADGGDLMEIIKQFKALKDQIAEENAKEEERRKSAQTAADVKKEQKKKEKEERQKEREEKKRQALEQKKSQHRGSDSPPSPSGLKIGKKDDKAKPSDILWAADADDRLDLLSEKDEEIARMEATIAQMIAKVKTLQNQLERSIEIADGLLDKDERYREEIVRLREELDTKNDKIEILTEMLSVKDSSKI